jgi:hypothetical protein
MSKDYLIGKRVRLISNEISDMENDPNPIKKGSMGMVFRIGGTNGGTPPIIVVNWDNGRELGLIDGEDQYEIVE